MFDLFTRLRPEGDGTGLGLALVKQIVKKHEGTAWVESEGSGRGSRFCFSLPWERLAAAPEEAQPAKR